MRISKECMVQVFSHPFQNEIPMARQQRVESCSMCTDGLCRGFVLLGAPRDSRDTTALSKEQQISPWCCQGVKWDRNLFLSQLVLWCGIALLLLFRMKGLILSFPFSPSFHQSKWDSTNPAIRATSAEGFYKLL